VKGGGRGQTAVWVIVCCTAVPLVAALALLAVRCTALPSHPRRHTQRHIATKSFADHVIPAAGSAATQQQLALGYLQHQVDCIYGRLLAFRAGGYTELGELYPQLKPVFCSLAVLDPSVGHFTDVLSPLMSVLCHSD